VQQTSVHQYHVQCCTGKVVMSHVTVIIQQIIATGPVSFQVSNYFHYVFCYRLSPRDPLICLLVRQISLF